MQRPSHWPAGPTFYAAQHQRPPLQVGPSPLFPYSGWGRIHATTIWNDAGRCRDAGQSSDQAWFDRLIGERTTPNSAKPYLRRGEWPPEPGSSAYFADIRPQFRYGPSQERHWIDWWYEHFTSDSPRYQMPDSPGAEPPPERPPRDWPAQQPPGESPAPPATPPVYPPTDQPPPPYAPPADEPGPGPLTIGGQPPEPVEAGGPPWGWIIGGSAVALLIGGGVAYAVTRPKRKRG